MAIDDPSIQTDHAAKNLDNIIRAAGAIEIETTQKLNKHEEGKRRAAGAEVEATRGAGNPEAGVYGDAMVKELAPGLEFIQQGVAFLQDRNGAPHLAGINKINPLISAEASTIDDILDAQAKKSEFSLSERFQITSSALTGESFAMGDRHKQKTEGMEGADEFQSATVEKIANANKLAVAKRLQIEYSQQLAHRQIALGMTPIGAGAAPAASLMSGPRINPEDLLTEAATG